VKILQRYYIREFFKLLGIIAFGLALIFSVLDLIDKIDNFMPGKPTIFKLMLYAFLNMPKYLYYLLPMSLLICSLFVFSQASRNKELTVVKATGGRLKKLFYPFLMTGVFFSILGFIIGEIIMPDFSERSNKLKNTLMKKGENLSFKEGSLWLKGTDGSIIKIELYVPQDKIAKGVSIFILEDTSIRKRIEAGEAIWEGTKKTWKLKNAFLYDIEKGTIGTMPEMDYPYLGSPDFFREEIKKPEDMGIGELFRYSERLKNAGFRDTKLAVDLHSKASYPLTNFLMLLFGISLSVMRRIGGGMFAAGLGLFISFSYWLIYTFMLSLGFARIIPPVLAAWLIPLIFGTVSIYLFSRIPE
jgi:lipopolysaccharide export system permease protein